MLPKIGIDAGGDKPMESVLGAFDGSVSEVCQIILYCDLSQSAEARYGTNRATAYNERFLKVEHCERGLTLPQALKALARGEIHALITATNSAALLRQTFKLGFWSRESPKPALLAPIPVTKDKFGYIMDAGLTARESDPEVFFAWAEMGRKFLQRNRSIAAPRIRLVNTSAERAFLALEKIDVALDGIPGYDGYGEPEDFWKGLIDLWLCDGREGNLLLKETEAVAKATAKRIITNLTTDVSKVQAMTVMDQLSYGGENLLSPVILPNDLRIFRIHGDTPSGYIGKAFWLACEKFNINAGQSTW